MEKFAYKIEQLLQEMLFLYKKFQRILENEKAHIVDMDVDSLWETIAQKNKIALKLDSINHILLALMEKRANELSVDSSSFNLSDLIGKLPVSGKTKSNLRKTKLALDICKESVSSLALANKNYLDEFQMVINDIFSMVVDTAEKKQYSDTGTLLENKEKYRFISAEV